MNRLEENRKARYRTWDDAFRGLSPLVRQQSVRTADYAQILYGGACQAACYQKERGKLDLDESYAEVAYKCGLYHQLGKALFPTEMQMRRSDFTPEEEASYRSYPTKGKELVAHLQGLDPDEEDISVPCRMIQEACAQHMERWDGSGYPEGLSGSDISLIAQIVGLAKELDRLATGVRSEDPFGDALDLLAAERGARFSTELISVLSACRGELQATYRKYIRYTRAIPRTVPLVDKRPERPLGLLYTPLVADAPPGQTVYEAVPWFKGAEDDPKRMESLKEVEALLERTGLLGDVCAYLLYEAADALVRLENCSYPAARVMLDLPAGFYQLDGQAAELEQMFENQGVDRRKLLLAVPEDVLRCASLAVYTRLTEYAEQGFALALDGWRPEHVPLRQIQEIGIPYVRPAEGQEELSEELHAHGISVPGPPAENLRFTEDELIRSILMSE